MDLDKEGHGINMMEFILITLISGLDLSDSDDDATWDPSKEREANNSRSRYVDLHLTKAELMLLKLFQFFAREVLLVKKLEIEETKTT